MNFLRTLITSRTFLIIAAGLVVVPILAYQNMLRRTGKEAAVTTVAPSPAVPDLLLEVPDAGPARVVYQDGSKKDQDALGLLVLTWDEFKQAPERFNGTGVVWLKEVFPVLAFFNASGFDASANPVLIRSAKDGKILFQSALLVPTVRLAILQTSGDLKVLQANSWHTVGPTDWDRLYAAHGDVLPPDKLAGLPDDKLRDLGYVKVPRDSSGIYGHVIKVGGNVNAVEPLELTVKVFQGKTGPQATDRKLAAEVKSARDGTFTVILPPGEYTLAIDEQGKLYGNAFDQSSWPSIVIEAKKWIEYEFRRSP